MGTKGSAGLSLTGVGGGRAGWAGKEGGGC